MKTRKRANISVVLLLIILVCANILASYFHFRWDLTSEKRFTLTPSTKEYLQGVNDDVYVTVYLKGEFPAAFKKLAESARMTLQDFRQEVGANFRYQFINPLEGINEPEERDQVFKTLANRGIYPTELKVKSDNKNASSIIFPRALVQYKGGEIPINLLEERFAQSPQEQLNASESLLEYKFVKALSLLSKPDKDRVAIIAGQDEELSWKSYESLNMLSKMYNLDTIDLDYKLDISPAFKAAVILKPQSAFTEQDKFVIDQYVMHGGNILWCVEKLKMEMDQLQKSEATMAVAEDLNLDDLLFKYGVRLNADFIQDMSCNPIPVIIGESQGVPQTELKPWVFYPILMSDSKHPISHNMDAVATAFVSSLDTIQNNIDKTILLHSSEYSRTVPSPVRVSLSMLRAPLDQKYFDKPKKNVAILLEGKFESLYKNRLPDEFLKGYTEDLGRQYKDKSDGSKMIVISDGDIMLNGVSQKNGPMPWGYYNFTQQHFANPQFIMNCLDYLVDEDNILAARSKDIKLRVLDLKKTKKDKLKWQLINIVIPILIILGAGVAYRFFRKRKYEGIANEATA